MFEFTKRQEYYIKTLIGIILTVLFVVLFITKILPYVAPFVVAIFMTFIIEKPVELLQRKLRLSRSFAVAIAILMFVIIVGSVLIFVFYQITTELADLTREFPSLYSISDYFQSFIEKSQNVYLEFPEEVVKAIEDNIGSIVGTISSWLTKLFMSLLNIVKSLPELFIFMIVSIVATFFMSRDREEIARFIYRQFPVKWDDKLRIFKSDLFTAFIGFIKAQLTLILITFLELLVGYIILGVDYAFFFAILTAVVDAIPILGVGTILIPTSFVHLIMGNMYWAFGFLLLYIVILIVRQFLEPRIMGSKLGIHPLAMLMAIYIGLKVFGVSGLILGPVIVVILKALQKSKIIPQFKLP